MKKTLLFLFLLFINAIYASAQTTLTSDFSFNIVKVTSGTNGKNVPKYGFITGTDQNNQEFYFVMIYPSNMEPLPTITVNYITEGIEKEKMKSVRANLIPYDGIVQIAAYRIVVYQAEGHTSIRRQFVQSPNLEDRASHKIYVNRAKDENKFIPDIFDHAVELNAKHLDAEKDEVIDFRMLEKIPGIIASGYPVVDINGDLDALIASPDADETFSAININTIKNKLAVMSNSADLCKYFGMIYKGYTATYCSQPFKDDSTKHALELIAKKRKLAQLHDVDYPVAISLGGNATGIYTNVGGTVRPGFGYSGELNIHILPDDGMFGITLTPRYGSYHYYPKSDYIINTSGSSTNYSDIEYTLTSATQPQLNLQLMGEFRFNRRLHGQNYIGVGYSRAFTQQGSYLLNISDSGNNMITDSRYSFPSNKFNSYIVEIGWDMSKVRYSISTTFMPTNPLPANYSTTIDNHVVSPFSGMDKANLFFNFKIAYRLWGHWRNGIKG